MVTEDTERFKSEGMSAEQWGVFMAVTVCLVTALLAGFTVVAMDGTIEWTEHHTDQYNDWYEEKVIKFGPMLQGFLGFLTMSFFLLSIYTLMVVHSSRSK